MVLVKDQIERLRPSSFACSITRSSSDLVETVARADVDAPVPRGHRAEAVLRLPRMPDLPHRERIERQGESACNLGGNRHAAARETDDDRISELDALECAGELAPGIDPIVEETAHAHPW